MGNPVVDVRDEQMVPETGIEPVRPLFTKRRILSPMCLPISPLRHGCIVKQKSLTNLFCEALQDQIDRENWRRDPESNWARRICNPLHNRFAIAPKNSDKKGKHLLPFSKTWSGKRGSNSRPIPWQGIALPTELIPHVARYQDKSVSLQSSL